MGSYLSARREGGSGARQHGGSTGGRRASGRQSGIWPPTCHAARRARGVGGSQLGTRTVDITAGPGRPPGAAGGGRGARRLPFGTFREQPLPGRLDPLSGGWKAIVLLMIFIEIGSRWNPVAE
jgi:hypothetical protein